MKRVIRHYAASLFGVVLVLGLFAATQYPNLLPAEAAQLAARFKFTRLPLAEVAGHPPRKSVRAVHPSLARISARISSLGAGATFADLDGDGLPNDLVLIDPRTDLVTIACAPGTGRLPLCGAWMLGFVPQGVLYAWYFGTPIHPWRQALSGFSVAMVYGVIQVMHLFFALITVCAIRGLALHIWNLMGRFPAAEEKSVPSVGTAATTTTGAGWLRKYDVCLGFGFWSLEFSA